MNSNFFYSLEQPLHTLPGCYQLRSVNLRNFPVLVSRLGGNYRDILDRHNISYQAIEDAESFIDCQSFVDVFEYCAIKLNDPLFGMHMAQLQQADVYGFVTLLCRSAASVRDGIHCLIDYLPVIHSPESVLELVEGNDVSELRWMERSHFENNDQTNCQGLLLNLKILQELGGVDFTPAYVNLPLRAYPKTGSDIEQLIGCPVRTGSERSCIAFPSEWLDRPVPGTNPALFQLLKGYMFRLKAMQSSSLADKVIDYLGQALNGGDISIEGCARKLGVSARTLQMRLRKHGSSFSDILDQQRMERARYFLLTGDLPIAEVADLLGYSERASFGRAFKRWVGLSPQQFRQSRLV